MIGGEVVELEIPSSPEYVAIARYAIEGIAQRMLFSNSQIEDLKIAVGEACTNAVKYGVPGADPCVVAMRCEAQHDGLMVEIRNNINGCAKPCVPAVPDTGKEGGFGLYIMNQLMDEVHIQWGPHVAVVRMVKRLVAA